MSSIPDRVARTLDVAMAGRSMEQALADLTAEFQRMKFTDPRRGPMAIRIVRLEDEIRRRQVS